MKKDFEPLSIFASNLKQTCIYGLCLGGE